jgi:hypothetical protein
MGLIPERQVLKKNSPLSVQGTDNGEFGGDRRFDPVFRGPPFSGLRDYRKDAGAA